MHRSAGAVGREIRFRPYEWDRVEKGMARLLGLVGGTAAAVRGGLRELVPEYRPDGES